MSILAEDFDFNEIDTSTHKEAAVSKLASAFSRSTLDVKEVLYNKYGYTIPRGYTSVQLKPDDIKALIKRAGNFRRDLFDNQWYVFDYPTAPILYYMWLSGYSNPLQALKKFNKATWYTSHIDKVPSDPKLLEAIYAAFDVVYKSEWITPEEDNTPSYLCITKDLGMFYMWNAKYGNSYSDFINVVSTTGLVDYFDIQYNEDKQELAAAQKKDQQSLRNLIKDAGIKLMSGWKAVIDPYTKEMVLKYQYQTSRVKSYIPPEVYNVHQYILSSPNMVAITPINQEFYSVYPVTNVFSCAILNRKLVYELYQIQNSRGAAGICYIRFGSNIPADIMPKKYKINDQGTITGIDEDATREWVNRRAGGNSAGDDSAAYIEVENAVGSIRDIIGKLYAAVPYEKVKNLGFIDKITELLNR